MSYETTVYVCEAPIPQMLMDEYKRDMTKPFADGSGYELARDKDGKVIYTGKKEQWLNPILKMELGVIAGQNDLGKLLLQKSRRYKDVETFYYVYSDDGNTKIHSDKYGDLMRDFTIQKMLEAATNAYKQTKYERLNWLATTLKVISKDVPNAICLTYGH